MMRREWAYGPMHAPRWRTNAREAGRLAWQFRLARYAYLYVTGALFVGGLWDWQLLPMSLLMTVVCGFLVPEMADYERKWLKYQREYTDAANDLEQGFFPAVWGEP